MTGKPAARISDEVVSNVIITGSATVLIGSQGGIACSACPGGMKVGSPVNPQLGAKVLSGPEDLDFALPGALALIWQRQYSSYVNVEHGAPCGPLGYGWKLPQQISIRTSASHAILFDAGGRAITFESLAPGGSHYSASEDLWLLRGGASAAWAGQPRWAHAPPELAKSADCILAASGRGDTLWLFAPIQPGHDVGNWPVVAQLDRFGRSQRYERDEAGRIARITDGVGRRYRLQHGRIHTGKDAQGPWGADDGWRLVVVEVEHDPLAPGHATTILVRYGYTRDGDLASVHDRAGELVREYTTAQHRMTAHRHAGGPLHTYRYDGNEAHARVIEHTNEQGLSYQFDYFDEPTGESGRPRSATRVTDSLGRVNTYHFEGEAGLARLIRHERPDASELHFAYDGAGRLVERTDPLGRTTRMRLDERGHLIGLKGPGGSQASQRYDEVSGLLQESIDPTGATTRYQYDAWGRLSSVIAEDGSSEHYHYPDPGQSPLICEHACQIDDARGGTKELVWSAAGLLVSYTDCSGQQGTRYQYDRWGQLMEVSNALSQTVKHERDTKGRITATRNPDGSTERYQYDRAGRVTCIQRETAQGHMAGDTVRLRYDLWGRLVEQSYGGLALQFEHDVAGRLTRLINQNQSQTRLAWDVMDRLVHEEGFDQRLQSYIWDAAGQLIEAKDGNDRSQQSTYYRWDDSGRLKERVIPTTERSPASVQRFKWDKAGRLKATSVLLADQDQDQQQQLQSHIEIQRDLLGRITEEVQQVHDAQGQVEFEHRITHQLDVLGNRQTSTLQGLGEIGYLHYGAGHVHGITHNGQSLVDLERDALHRETKRQLYGVAGTQPIEIERQWDSLGRISRLRSRHLHAGAAPQSLIGQLIERQYSYDALGQLTGIQIPGEKKIYEYDDAGRLRSEQIGQRFQRWDVDPAGNRLPGATLGGQLNSAPSWAAQVHRHWKQEQFNLLGEGQAAGQSLGSATQWPDNRIGYSQERAWRYDAMGNRTEQANVGGQDQRLYYNGANQLIEVEVMNKQDNKKLTSRYLYDGLGRRLKKQAEDERGINCTWYGWDGDRLVHTESQTRPPEGSWRSSKHVSHTVYEPNSFTPLIQLSTNASTPKRKGFAALLEVCNAHEDEDDTQELESGSRLSQSLLAAMPTAARQVMERSLKLATKRGLPASIQLAMGTEISAQTEVTLRKLQNEQQKQEEDDASRITVRHYHCNHLGTPIALTNLQGEVVWAAKSDPWGNVAHEFNCEAISQSIRLPGQYEDEETGLHYNRHRYYDPAIGTYVNQDPIGLTGGVNGYMYPANPNTHIDPLGLQSFPMMGAGTQQQASLGIHLMQQGATPEQFSNAMNNRQEGWSVINKLRKIPRADGLPLGAGCGDAKTDNFVPDKPLGYDFLPGCKKHDACYGDKKGPSKAICDNDFHENLMITCELYEDDAPLFAGGSGMQKSECSGIAAIYYQAVHKYGGDAFDAARK